VGFSLVNRGVLLDRIREILQILYPWQDTDRIFRDLRRIVDRYENSPVIREKRRRYDDRVMLSEEDATLITYADSILEDGERPGGSGTGRPCWPFNGRQRRCNEYACNEYPA